MQYKRIVVTGGCGFIGSHFINHLLSTHPNLEVLCVDSLTYAAHPDTVEYLGQIAPRRYQFHRIDITSPEFTAFLKSSQCDAVVNFAAETHVDRSILDPASFVRTNVMGVQNILDFIRSQPKVRFVHVSTDEVYGTLGPKDPSFTEQHTLDPNSPYAASKASADLLALANQRTFGLDILITRCSNNYGPFQFPEKLIPLVIANAVEDKNVPVYGDGKQVRDWIYVLDHCTGIESVLNKGRAGEVYNLSAHEERFNIDMVHKILSILKKPLSLIQHVGDRPAHDRRYSLDSTKTRKELGWKPKYSFDSAIAETVQWYLTNESWWKKVRDKKFFEYYQNNYSGKFENKKQKEAVLS